KTLVAHIDDRVVGVDGIDNAHTGKRVSALREQARFSGLGRVIHHHQHLASAHGKVHGAANGGDGIGRVGEPVREIPVARHLEAAQDAEVETSAPHHCERCGVVGDGGAGYQHYRHTAGVYQVGVGLIALGGGSHVPDAVLAAQPSLAIGGKIFGH